MSIIGLNSFDFKLHREELRGLGLSERTEAFWQMMARFIKTFGSPSERVNLMERWRQEQARALGG